MLFGCFQPCFSGSLSREADPASLVAQSAAWLATQTIKCEESVVRSCSTSGEAERIDVFSRGMCAPLWLLSATVSLIVSHASLCEINLSISLMLRFVNLCAGVLCMRIDWTWAPYSMIGLFVVGWCGMCWLSQQAQFGSIRHDKSWSSRFQTEPFQARTLCSPRCAKSSEFAVPVMEPLWAIRIQRVSMEKACCWVAG